MAYLFDGDAPIHNPAPFHFNIFLKFFNIMSLF